MIYVNIVSFKTSEDRVYSKYFCDSDFLFTLTQPELDHGHEQ